MFSQQKHVLFIEKSKLSLFEVSLDKKLTKKGLFETDWSLGNLQNILLKIKKNINKPLRILLSDEFVYIETLAVKSSGENEREEVRLKAQELIPDDLNLTLWDFKEILSLNKNGQEKIVQVLALTQTFYQKVYSLMIKTGFQIEAMEPVSYALARFLKNISEPTIIAHISSLNNLIMVKNGLVLATKDNKKEITFNDLKSFMEYVKKTFSVTPKNIYFYGNTKNLNLKNFETLGLKAEIHAFDPISSLALKSDIKGADAKVLNLFPSNQSAEQSRRQNDLIKIIMYIAAFLFLISAAAYFVLKITLDNF